MTAPIKRGYQATLPQTQQRMLPEKLGDYIAQDATMMEMIEWEKFVKERQGRWDLTNLEKVGHPDRCLI